MHFIQKHILDKLRKSDSIRYAQLNPGDVESGHFRYHLTQLIKDGYIEQMERGLYRLSVDGQRAVDKLSEKRIHANVMPKVITYTLLKNNNFVFLQNKQKQPYMNLLNMIGGKVHEGETTQTAATREVYEKTGVFIKDPHLAGVFEILINNEDNLLSHVIAYVYVSEVETPDSYLTTLETIEKSTLHNIDNLAPDFLIIFDKIHKVPHIQIETLEVLM